MRTLYTTKRMCLRTQAMKRKDGTAGRRVMTP